MISNSPYNFSAPLSVGVSVATANPNRDGTGTLALLCVATTTPLRIDWVHINAIVTTTSGMIRLFLFSGGNYYLINEIPVSAIVPSATSAAFSVQYYPTPNPSVAPSPLTLQAGAALYVSTEKAEQFRVTAFGGYY